MLAFKEFNYRDGIWGAPGTAEELPGSSSSGQGVQVTRNTFSTTSLFLACYTFFSVLMAILVAR